MRELRLGGEVTILTSYYIISLATGIHFNNIIDNYCSISSSRILLSFILVDIGDCESLGISLDLLNFY